MQSNFVMMNEDSKKALTTNMSDNLHMLRSRLGLTQDDVSRMTGVSRHTIITVESHRREMSWSTFLLLLFIFMKNPETAKLLPVLEIYTDELDAYLQLKLPKA